MGDKAARGKFKLRGITDERVLAALEKVPREAFLPPEQKGRALEDTALPIGYRQTISQPYVVAVMTQALALGGGEKILEIGTGSGYQAAVLAELGARVFSIEIVEPLARRAAETLRALGYDDVRLRCGDGYWGWPEEAPFDRIIATAAPEAVPLHLLDQMTPRGRMVLPVGGSGSQVLLLLSRDETGTTTESLLPVRFVPMTGAASLGRRF